MYVWMLHVCICMCIYTYIMYIWTYIDICIYIYNYIYTCTCAGLQRHPLVCFLTATWIEKWNLIFLNTCFNLCGSEDNMRVSAVISFGQRDDAPSKIRFEDFWDFKVFLRVRNPYASFFTIWSQAILEYALKFIPKKIGETLQFICNFHELRDILECERVQKPWEKISLLFTVRVVLWQKLGNPPPKRSLEKQTNVFYFVRR